MNKKENEELYEETRGLIYTIAHNMLKEGEDVDELVAEVWVSDEFQKADKKRRGTAAKFAIQKYRQNRDGLEGTRRRQVATAQSLSEVEVTGTDEGFEAVDNRDFFNKVMSFCEKSEFITQSHNKEVLELVVVGGRTVNEAAEIIGISRQAVASIRDKVLKHLRLHFRDSE